MFGLGLRSPFWDSKFGLSSCLIIVLSSPFLKNLILEGEIPMKKIISILMITLFLGGTFLLASGCYTPPEGSRRGNDGHSSSGGHSH
jgi:hypothetical protein